MKKVNKRRYRLKPGRHALWLISFVLVGSVIIRISLGASNAVALEADNSDSGDESVAMAVDERRGGMVGEAASCEGIEKVTRVLKNLSEREAMIEKREVYLRDRAAALSLAETEIRKNLVALEEAEAKLAKTLSIADTAAESDLARLTAVYENMKPKQAATLFEEMPPEFAAGFLGRMRPDAAAAIMAGLESASAYSISVVLAGRNANAPRE